MTEVYIAQDVAGRKTPSLLLHGKAHFPECSTLKECSELHKKEARIIAKALIQSLAGGTIDALLVELLKNNASLLVIPQFIGEVIDDSSS